MSQICSIWLSAMYYHTYLRSSTYQHRYRIQTCTLDYIWSPDKWQIWVLQHYCFYLIVHNVTVASVCLLALWFTNMDMYEQIWAILSQNVFIQDASAFQNTNSKKLKKMFLETEDLVGWSFVLALSSWSDCFSCGDAYEERADIIRSHCFFWVQFNPVGCSCGG